MFTNHDQEHPGNNIFPYIPGSDDPGAHHRTPGWSHHGSLEKKKTMMQLQLFRTVSYDPKKRVYWIDLGFNKFASIRVDENDRVLKTSGFGHRSWLYGRYRGIATGKSIVEDYMNDLNRKISALTGLGGSSEYLPITVDKPVLRAQFMVHKKNCNDPERAIANYLKRGFKIKLVAGGESFYVHTTYQ